MEIKYRRDLPALMKELKLPMIAAEIGVAEGLNSRDLLASGLEKLYMVDVWEQTQVSGDGSSPNEWHDANFNNVKKLTAPFGNRAVILKGISTDMANHVPDNSLGLVYIDACHSYECVKADLTAWFPKLVKGGVMAGHDYLATEYGVREAVIEFCKDRYTIHIIPEDAKKDAGFYFYAN